MISFFFSEISTVDDSNQKIYSAHDNFFPWFSGNKLLAWMLLERNYNPFMLTGLTCIPEISLDDYSPDIVFTEISHRDESLWELHSSR